MDPRPLLETMTWHADTPAESLLDEHGPAVEEVDEVWGIAPKPDGLMG